MRVIISTWGISWEGIYEILFPGASVPSPCKPYYERGKSSLRVDLAALDYEADDITPDSLESSSSRSQELRDFEVYNRTTLPLLVEASLRPIIESQIAPMGEMVIDIVRTCQSTVARNFNLLIAPTSSVGDRTPPPLEITPSVEAAERTHEESPQTLLDGTTRKSPDFFHEPPHLGAEASASSLSSTYHYRNLAGRQTLDLDFRYESSSVPCSCTCHDHSDTLKTANSKKLSNCAPDFPLMKSLRSL